MRADSGPDPARLRPQSARSSTLALLLATAPHGVGAQRRHEPVQRDNQHAVGDAAQRVARA